MTFIPTQTGFLRLEDSPELLRAIFPNYPGPGTLPRLGARTINPEPEL